MDELTVAEFWAQRKKSRARVTGANGNGLLVEVEALPCPEGGKARRVWMPAFGKARPRVTENGTYMPAAYEQNRAALRAAFGDAPAGLVHLSVTVERQMPASWSQRKRDRTRGHYAAATPDIDNVIGAVMDALFANDSRVISVFGERRWADVHALAIEIVPAAE